MLLALAQGLNWLRRLAFPLAHSLPLAWLVACLVAVLLGRKLVRRLPLFPRQSVRQKRLVCA